MITEARPADSEGPDDTSDSELGESAYLSVVHITVAVGPEPEADEISQAFDLGLDLVQTSVRALHAATGRSLQLPTHESAGLGALVALSASTNGRLVLRWPLGLFLLNPQALEPARLTDAELDLLPSVELREAAHHPSMLVYDIRREAVTASRLEGNTRTAVVMAATACESFIDLTLGALLWEEGSTPEEAAAEMNRYRDTSERLHRLLGPRLKGSWDLERVPELQSWRELVMKSRNRVVHAGGLPSPGLAERACQAMFGFFRLILDRLASDGVRNRYPMSAVMVAGRSGLEPRNAWTRKIRMAADEADELDMGGVFGRWYSVTSEIRLPAEMRRFPGSTSVIKYVVGKDDRAYWVEHDEASGLARLVQPVGDVTALVAITDSFGKADSYSFDNPPTIEPAGPWVQEHRLLKVALMRDPTAWEPPPDAPPPPRSAAGPISLPDAGADRGNYGSRAWARAIKGLRHLVGRESD